MLPCLVTWKQFLFATGNWVSVPLQSLFPPCLAAMAFWFNALADESNSSAKTCHGFAAVVPCLSDVSRIVRQPCLGPTAVRLFQQTCLAGTVPISAKDQGSEGGGGRENEALSLAPSVNRTDVWRGLLMECFNL